MTALSANVRRNCMEITQPPDPELYRVSQIFGQALSEAYLGGPVLGCRLLRVTGRLTSWDRYTQLNRAHNPSADPRGRPGDDRRVTRGRTPASRGRTRIAPRPRRHHAVARDDGRVVACPRRRDTRVGAARTRRRRRRRRGHRRAGRLGVRPAESARQPAVPPRDDARRERARIRVRDRRRPLPPGRPVAGTGAGRAECCRFRRRAASKSCRGQIDREHTSLVSAIDAAGETIDLTLALAGIFGGEIDFSTELQPGDRFELSRREAIPRRSSVRRLRPRCWRPSSPTPGATFARCGSRRTDGSPAYYDEHGRSMRRFFLASPLKFQPVVTSAFSTGAHASGPARGARHLGVDYRAPAGAPVVAVADGVVVSAGMSGGAGTDGPPAPRQRFRNRIPAPVGDRASVPGRACGRASSSGSVGSSGLATGPHLDYRLKKNGAFINPVTAHRAMPPADPIPAAEMAAFEAARDRAMAALTVPAPSAVVTNPNAPLH